MKDLFENHINGAKMSPEKDYRYALWRVWDDSKAMFIGLNPSTANETENDPTIRRVIRFARDWGNGDLFKLIGKASSKNEGWMKSTKAMCIEGVGAVVQVTTQQGQNVAEAVTFVPGVKMLEHKDTEGNVTSRELVAIDG